MNEHHEGLQPLQEKVEDVRRSLGLEDGGLPAGPMVEDVRFQGLHGGQSGAERPSANKGRRPA